MCKGKSAQDLQTRGEKMRRILAIFTFVFAFTLLSAAQTGGASGSSGAQAGTDEHAAHKKGGGGGTLTGCLSGPNDEGVYDLKSGKRTVEVGGLDDLSKHVGHEVRLHGSWAKSGSEIGEKEAAGGSESKEGKEEKGERHFKVASIDHVSDTCKAASGAGAKTKKGGGESSSTTPK
jgi:hypothetical protein